MAPEQNEAKQPEQQTTKQKNEPVSITMTTINMSPDELEKVIAEAIIMATQENDSNTKVNPEQKDTNTKKQRRGLIFIFALGFPFISDKKLLESSSNEDPFSLIATAILKLSCWILYVMAIIAFVNGIAVLCNTPISPDFLQYPAHLLFFVSFLFYTASLLCRMAAAHLDKKQDSSLALSFLALFVSILTLILTA